jgi:hypothetical protein
MPKERLARPIQETKRASWFLRVMALLPGQAIPEIEQAHVYLPKSEGRKRLGAIDTVQANMVKVFRFR